MHNPWTAHYEGIQAASLKLEDNETPQGGADASKTDVV